MSVIVAVAFFGGIAVSDVFGYMQVTVPAIENIQQSGKYLNIADLRG